MFEPGPARWPGVERTHRAGLPDRDLMALAEIGRGIPVELEDLGQRRRRVRADRGVAGRGGRQLRDGAHADRVMVSAAQERSARRGAQGGRVEPRVLEPVRGEPFGDRGGAGATERAGRPEAEVIQQHDQDVRRSSGRTERRDRREYRRRVLRVICGQADLSPIGDRQDIAAPRIGHRLPPLPGPPRLQARSCYDIVRCLRPSIVRDLFPAGEEADPPGPEVDGEGSDQEDDVEEAQTVRLDEGIDQGRPREEQEPAQEPHG